MSLVSVDEIYNQISTVIEEKNYSLDNVVSIAKKVVKIVMEYKDYGREEQSKLVQAVMRRVVDESPIPDGIKIQLNFGLQLLLPDVINMAFKYYDNKQETQAGVVVPSATAVVQAAAQSANDVQNVIETIQAVNPQAAQPPPQPPRNNVGGGGCNCIIS